MTIRAKAAPFFFLGLQVLYAKDPPPALPAFQKQTLHAEGTFSVPVLKDVNRDGFLDLAVPLRSDRISASSRNQIALYLNRNGCFSPAPDQTLTIDEPAALFDFANTDGDSNPDLLTMNSRGVFRHSLSNENFNSSPDMLLLLSAVLPEANVNPPIYWPFASCLSISGFRNLCVPERDGIGLFSKSAGGGFRMAASVPLPLVVTADASRYHPRFVYELPELQTFSYGDSVSGCVFISDDRAIFVDANRIGRPDTSASPFPEFRFDPYYSGADRNLVTRLEFHDFNRDGEPDALLFLSPRKGLFTPPGQVRLYLNRGGKWNAVPDQVLLKDCFFGDHAVADFNGDGLPDLCLIGLEADYVNAARYLLDRKVRNRFDLYLTKPDGSIGQEPDRSVVLSRKQGLRLMFYFPLVVGPVTGDFNGDGSIDLGFWSGQAEFTLVFGSKTRWLDSRHTLKIHEPRTDAVLVEDLNRDGRSDLVFGHPQSVTVLVSAPNGGF